MKAQCLPMVRQVQGKYTKPFAAAASVIHCFNKTHHQFDYNNSQQDAHYGGIIGQSSIVRCYSQVGSGKYFDIIGCSCCDSLQYD